MRTALTALIAFAAGALLILLADRAAFLRPGQEARPVTAISSPAQATTSAAAPAEGSSSADDASNTVDDWPSDAPSPEQVMTAQPQMLRDAIAKLSPRVAGRPNVYVIAFAGDGAEDVFRNEAEYTDTLFARRFGAPGHTLILENHPDTLGTRPLASWTNLENAMDALSGIMHPDEDILLVYLTTHGGEDHSLLVDLDPLPLDQIDPEGLAGMLKKRAFRWKVVVVNACYSGGFVKALQGPGTLVLTSARADRSSFGCGSESDITYFGKAWLVDGLNRSPDFIEAFHQAAGEIASWETRDKLTPSEPQIDIGPGIAEHLAVWRKSFPPGAAVEFKPAPAMP
jgi:Peptidase C13 family